MQHTPSRVSSERIALTLTLFVAISFTVVACEGVTNGGGPSLRASRANMETKVYLNAAPPPAPEIALEAQQPPYFQQPANTERYPDARPNPVKIVRDEPVSTFSVDVDTAS